MGQKIAERARACGPERGTASARTRISEPGLPVAHEQRKGCRPELFRGTCPASSEPRHLSPVAEGLWTHGFAGFQPVGIAQPDHFPRLGVVLAIWDRMRRRISLAVTLVTVFAVVPTVSTLRTPFAAVPIAILEPGSLLLLGIVFLILAAVAQRTLLS